MTEGQRSGLPKEADVVKRSGTESVQIPPAPPFNEPAILSEIAAIAFYLKKNGYRDSTIGRLKFAQPKLKQH
jgi:hypothetical protein